MTDLYEILGVSRDASKEDLKSAYRKLAMKYHPDKNPGDAAAEKKFKEISAAYDILKDDDKRAAYNRYGMSAFSGGMGGTGAHSGAAGSGFDFGDFTSGAFSDIFESFFGGAGAGGGGRRSRQSANVRGSDLRYNMDVTLEEAYRGDKKTIRVSTHAVCDTCKGSGGEDGGATAECEACNGQGRVRMQQGFFTIERTCAACQGTGTVIKKPCKHCHGQGRARKQKTLSVNIPRGVEEGTRIRLSGEGEAGLRGGDAGDLYIFVSLKKHPLFQREGNDIHCQVPVRMTMAALGGHVDVPTIDGGKVRVAIPAGTQSGHRFRLKGKGMCLMRSPERHGDMYVQVQVEVPVKLDERQRALLEEFDSSVVRTESSPESEGFFRKVKDFLDGLAG